MKAVRAPLSFFSRSVLESAQAMAPIEIDMRTTDASSEDGMTELVECTINDARQAPEAPSLDSTGYTVVHRPSAVRDWYDSSEVIDTYYRECRELARELTGASHAFTFDHIIREPGRQIGGGGTSEQDVITTLERGGGYLATVHMDYTDNSTWTDYLALHGHTEPVGASRVVVLNFWRPLFGSPDRAPLAVCDARTVTAGDLLETMLYGYGHEGYSWHDIGISGYQVAASPSQRWSYFSDMSPDEVLLMKTYDSSGVIGRGCPHASFDNPAAPPATPERHSIELRVLCFADAGDADGARVMTLEMRIARLEAAEAIRNLKARYCELCDDGYPPDALTALFTRDAVWDGGEILGVHHGREAIGQFFATMPSTLSFAIHHVTNPRIEVAADASSATGHWLLLQAATDPTGQHAMWFAATYEDEYVRTGEDWLFSHVTLSTRFLAPYERGWASKDQD